MQTIILIGIIAECLLLLFFAVFKKMTRKTFVIISAITALCCSVAIFFTLGQDKREEPEDKSKGYIYMASRLLEEGRPEDALTALGQISETEGNAYGALGLRSLAYNLSKEYSTGAYLLNECTDENLLSLKSACDNNETVSEELVNRLISESLDAVSLTEDEMARFDAEMSIRFLHNTGSATVEDATVQIQEAILLGNIDDAYNLAVAKAENGTIADAILVSEMYVRNYNQRFLSENDAAFNALLEDVTKYEVESYRIAAELGTESKEYIRSNAQYQLALSEWTRESGKRAINYLSYCDYEGTPYELAYNLQMAKLHSSFGDTVQAKKYLFAVFKESQADNSQLLATDICLLREVYLNESDNATSPEFNSLYCQLMRNLYQNFFESSTSDTFYFILRESLKDLYGGIYIGLPNTRNFPEVEVIISSIDELDLSANSMLLSDSNIQIKNYVVKDRRTDHMAISFVLDRSNSMVGEPLANVKLATKELFNKIDRQIDISLVSFATTFRVENPLVAHSTMLVDTVDKINIDGENGTNISAGLNGGLSSLSGYTGKKVIVLLSDGEDYYPEGMPGSLNKLVSENIVVYTVGLPGSDESYLRMISQETGGSYFKVEHTEDLDAVYAKIREIINNSYTISYTVPDPSKNERTIHIECLNSNIQARRKYSIENAFTQYGMVTDKQTSDYFKQIGGTLGGM